MYEFDRIHRRLEEMQSQNDELERLRSEVSAREAELKRLHLEVSAREDKLERTRLDLSVKQDELKKPAFQISIGRHSFVCRFLCLRSYRNLIPRSQGGRRRWRRGVNILRGW